MRYHAPCAVAQLHAGADRMCAFAAGLRRPAGKKINQKDESHTGFLRARGHASCDYLYVMPVIAAQYGTHALEQKVIELRLQRAPSPQLVDALNALALALWPVDLKRALAAAQEARAVAQLLGYHTGALTGLARMSWIHLQMGQFDAALLEAHEAQFFAERMDDYVLTLNAWHTIVFAYQLAADFKKAEAGWLKMLEIARAHGDTLREADYLMDIGNLYRDLGQYLRAIDLTLQAKNLYTTHKDDMLAMAQNNIAFYFAKLGFDDEALTWAEDALAHCNPDWAVWRAEFLKTLILLANSSRGWGESSKG